jgi:hypothetical protein
VKIIELTKTVFQAVMSKALSAGKQSKTCRKCSQIAGDGFKRWLQKLRLHIKIAKRIDFSKKIKKTNYD